MNNGKIKKVTIFALILTIFVMSVAYAVLYQNLRINGNASVVASWRVEIIGIKEGSKTGTAESSRVPSYTSSTATFNAMLYDTSDSIEYVITVKNNGKIDAKLDNLTTIKSNDDTIIYEVLGVSENDVLKAGEELDVTVRVSIDPNKDISSDMNSNLTVIFNYIQNV